jgi:hypothetical protein
MTDLTIGFPEVLPKDDGQMINFNLRFKALRNPPKQKNIIPVAP